MSVTNWTLDDIMHNMSMPQLMLVFDRYPKHNERAQPDIDKMQIASTYQLENLAKVPR